VAFIYDADDYSDDLPFWSAQTKKPHLIVPYTLDTNDMRFATAQGFNTAKHFSDYLIDAFDTLYSEGSTAPKMMSVGLTL
jgi:peptidoglycan/xylan/chitin deacetylase (PgdA/CDA1 family)